MEVKKIWKIFIFILSLGIFIAVSIWGAFLREPFNFPNDKFITIENGQTVEQVANTLKKERIIISSFWFRTAIRFGTSKQTVHAGEYHFERPENLIKIAKRFAIGDFGVETVKITIPEGTNSFEMADIFASKLENFNKDEFIQLALKKEGFLFPDTYTFPKNAKPQFVITTMEENFKRQTEVLLPDIQKFGKSLDEVVTMASLLEEEASDYNTRRAVSGVLWNRINAGMLLQVDAVFPYIIGKNTYEVSLADLKHDSPYNTYKYPGLPIGPITNPGISAIKAAMDPQSSNYLFYLSDRGGRTYFATNFETHKQNKILYLNRK